jgi:hypothetical protein
MTQPNPPKSNSSEIHPLVRIATLEKKVVQLEQRLAKLESPPYKTLPEQPKLESKLFEIIKVDSRITEVNNTWSKYAWILILKSFANKHMQFHATIEFLDKDGFIVDTSDEFNVLLPNRNDQTYTGFALIKAPVVGNIARIQAKVKLL